MWHVSIRDIFILEYQEVYKPHDYGMICTTRSIRFPRDYNMRYMKMMAYAIYDKNDISYYERREG